MTHGVLMGLKTTSLIDNLLIQNRTIFFTKNMNTVAEVVKKLFEKELFLKPVII